MHKVTMYDAPKEEKVDLTGKKKTTTTTPTYTPGPATSVVVPVQTGDPFSMIWFVLLGVSGLIVIGAVYKKRRDRINE